MTGIIDRQMLVSRHNPVLPRANPASPLSVGNGEFAFTADITGLQTFASEYQEVPLSTMAQWGWHTEPLPPDLRDHELRYEMFDTYGRKVGYATDETGQERLFHWLRQNPHRLNLARIGLRLTDAQGRRAVLADISQSTQTLNLWTGTLESRFSVFGSEVRVETCCHPERDVLAFRITSPLIPRGRLAIELFFPPYSSEWRNPVPEPDTAAKPTTQLVTRGSRGAALQRSLHADSYAVQVAWDQVADFAPEAPDLFLLTPQTENDFAWVVEFSASAPTNELPGPLGTFVESARHWERFWLSGGAVELAETPDPRALELERRVVLSQYLTAIQCAGSLPPQETGLTCNSWFGKFHLEMHWWHGVHFSLWGRHPLFEKSLGWYRSILPQARVIAARQGYGGARWPKMVGPEGKDAPSSVGTLLIWQQPHPLYYAELCYRANPSRETLEAWRDIVYETAEWMASYAVWDEGSGHFVLGPPLRPVSENQDATVVRNPCFELAYWRFGLRLAQVWLERLGEARQPQWDRVLDGLAPLPVHDGYYLMHEGLVDTYTRWNYEHPSLLGAMGFLPGDDADKETMRRTLKRVWDSWQWRGKVWGWDFPFVAMTAARVGEPDLAVEALLMDVPTNTYLPNGHNYQGTHLPLYLPGNGGLLSAVALMAGGWRGGPKSHAPGFPADWVVSHEALRTFL